MPTQKRKAEKAVKKSEPISSEEKIARLLGLYFVKDMEQKTDQAAHLRSVGFEVSEVATMLRITENHVNVAAFHGRKNLEKKKKAQPTIKTSPRILGFHKDANDKN